MNVSDSKRRKILMAIVNSVILVLGNALYAFAVAAFIMPNGVVVGGVISYIMVRVVGFLG